METNNNPLKYDDEVKSLIIDCLDGNNTGGGDIDALLKIEDNFIIIEFLRCITVDPFKSHPNYYWDYNQAKIGNKNKFLALWNIAKKTNSRLILINYEDSRERFKIIEVLGLDEKRKIYDEKITKLNYEQFKNWFKELNLKAT